MLGDACRADFNAEAVEASLAVYTPWYRDHSGVDTIVDTMALPSPPFAPVTTMVPLVSVMVWAARQDNAVLDKGLPVWRAIAKLG